MTAALTKDDRDAFRDVFNAVSKNKDGKINKEELADLFRLIDYKMGEGQFEEICAKLFGKKDTIVLEDFMKLFVIKPTDYTLTDVVNAFKLLAKDDDKFIKMSKIKKILEKSGLSEMEIIFLTSQLSGYTNTEGKVNYQDFLAKLAIS